MRMTDTPLNHFYTKISELEKNKSSINIGDYLNHQDIGYYELDGGIIKDLTVHNPNYQESNEIMNIDNISGACFPAMLHLKNGILDGTLSDMTSQSYQIGKEEKKYSRLVYDKTISYMNMDLIEDNLDYDSIYIECSSISNEIEYSILQILNIISRIDHPIDLYIKYSDNYSTSKQDISLCIFLINQIYNNKLIDKIKTINIPLYLFKILIMSSKFYKQVQYILGIENLILEIISEKDLNIDNIDKYKLMKYNIKMKNMYLYSKILIDDCDKINIIGYLNSFTGINKLYLPYIDKNLNEEILNEMYQLESKCREIKYYGYELNSNIDIILLNKDVECYFHEDYVLEIIDGIDNRLNIMFNDGIDYKLIYIDDTMNNDRYISSKIINNIEFFFIKDISDLSLVIQ